MRNYFETKLCIAFAEHLEIYFPRQRGLLDWTHIANEGRSPQEGAKLKKMGVRAGWFDYVFIWHDQIPKMGFLEAKVNGNGYSDSQKRFISVIEPMGVPYGKFETIEQGHSLLIEWGVPAIKDCGGFKKIDMRSDTQKKMDIVNLYYPPR